MKPTFDAFDNFDAPVVAEDSVPVGYRLTHAAILRVNALSDCANRHERRVLLAKFRKAPITTFELDT